MDNNKTFELDINTNTFVKFKNDFNVMLKEILTKMRKKEVEDADITVKMSIRLPEFYVAEIDRDCIMPVFTHKITSKMQLKSECQGTLAGKFELKQNKETGEYYLEEIKDNQTTMFDNKENEDD